MQNNLGTFFWNNCWCHSVVIERVFNDNLWNNSLKIAPKLKIYCIFKKAKCLFNVWHLKVKYMFCSKCHQTYLSIYVSYYNTNTMINNINNQKGLVFTLDFKLYIGTVLNEAPYKKTFPFRKSREFVTAIEK